MKIKLSNKVKNQIKLMEIEKAKALGRVARRKEQSRLRKKYNNKTIKISNNKSFKKGEELNIEQRRIVCKNKNLLV